MDYLLTVCRIGSCIGEHASLEFYFFLVRWNQVSWLWTIFHNANRIHTAIRRVTEVSIWMVAKRAGTPPSRVASKTNDCNFQVPRIGFSAANVAFGTSRECSISVVFIVLIPVSQTN